MSDFLLHTLIGPLLFLLFLTADDVFDETDHGGIIADQIHMFRAIGTRLGRLARDPWAWAIILLLAAIGSLTTVRV